MASAKTKRRGHRRDRRKAKASGFRRLGKGMGGRVGHGTASPQRLSLGHGDQPRPLRTKSKNQTRKAALDAKAARMALEPESKRRREKFPTIAIALTKVSP